LEWNLRFILYQKKIDEVLYASISNNLKPGKVSVHEKVQSQNLNYSKPTYSSDFYLKKNDKKIC